MNEEQIKEYLKENLSFYLDYDCVEDGIRLNWNLSLGEDTISKDYVYISKSNFR